MALVVYLVTALLLLWVSDRQLRPITRGAALVLILLPLCFTGRALLTGAVYGPVDLAYVTEPLSVMKADYGIGELHNGILSDLYTQMIPWRKAVQYAYSHHEWPLWNRFILSGDILAPAAQPAAYSPLTLIACLLPVGQSLTFTAAMTFFIAGLGMFLLLRELGCRETTAFIGAAGWMYSTSLAFFVLWSLSGAWCWLPFILFAIRRVVRDPGVRAGAALLAGFVMLLLAGHPETALHVVFAGALYALFEIASVRRRSGAAMLTLLAAGLTSLAVCAVYFLPILEAAPQTLENDFRRNIFSTMPRGVHIDESMARFVVDMLPFLHIRDWKLEHVGHLDFDTAATGSIVVVLAIFALVRSRLRDRWFFAALLLLGLLARAQWTPLMRGLAKLPLFDLTLNERLSFAAACSFAVLAGIGAEALAASEGDRRLALLSLAWLAVLAGGTAWMLQHPAWVSHQIPAWSQFKIHAELGGLGILAMLALVRGPSFRIIMPALLGLLLIQRVLAEGSVYPTLPDRASYPDVPLFASLKNIRKPFRVVGQGMTFVPGTSAMYELEDVRGYEAMTFERYFETYSLWCVHQPVFFNRVNDLSRPFLSFLNVRYAVSWESAPVPDGWRVAATDRTAKLLENLQVIERAFVPRRIRTGISSGDALNEMAEEKDFRERAWIDAPLPIQDIPNGAGTVTVRNARGGYRLTADMAANGWIVISEPAWSGWRIYIDGRRVSWYHANHAFLAVMVPKGHHNLRVTFLPHSFVLGRAITLVTVAGLLLSALVTIVRRRRVASEQS